MKRAPLRLPRALAWSGAALGIAGLGLASAGVAGGGLSATTQGCSPGPQPAAYCAIVVEDGGGFLEIADADAAGGHCPDGEIYQQPVVS